MSKAKNTPPAHAEYLSSLSKAKGFLGREFLTWLWYLSETKEGRMVLPHRFIQNEELEFDLWVDDRLGLEGASGYTHENLFKGGDPSRSLEAQAALHSGKTVKELKLGVNVKGHGEFTTILNAEDLNPRALKLPTLEAGDSPHEAEAEVPLLTRIRQSEMFLSILDGLFEKFLEERVGEQWETTGLEHMRTWVEGRQKAAESGTLH